MKDNVLVINKKDNVGVAFRELCAKEAVIIGGGKDSRGRHDIT